PIAFAQAALGAEVKVPTINSEVVLTIPAGPQAGKRVRLKENGVKNVDGCGDGNQCVTISVLTPTKHSDKEADLFGQLAEHSGEEINEQNENFFDKTIRFFKGD